MALPLAYYLWRSESIRIPRGFWLWAFFLVWVLGSAVALNLTTDGTLTPSGTGRYLAFAARLANYIAVTIMLLYVVNTSESQLPRRRLIGWLATLFVMCILLGTVAVVVPDLAFRSPLAAILPSQLVESAGSMRYFAQVQSVLGEPLPRPAAPFAYTNAWGNSVSLLLPWFVLTAGLLGGRRRQLLGLCFVPIALIPLIFSLNRGVWLGLILALAYVAVRLAVVGRTTTIVALAVTVAVGLTAFMASPLSDLVSARTNAGHSNQIRSTLAEDAVRLAVTSPIVGYGSTRTTEGSGNSIAVGQTPDCPRCGNRTIGSTGQVWLVLVAQGFVGAALYVVFFLYSLALFRRDHSPIGVAASVVLLLTLFYSLFYTASIVPLAVAFLSLGLLHRNAALRPQRTREGQPA